MAYLSLSRNDINVLEKIKDPESDPTNAVHIDPDLPRDPHVTDATLYQSIVAREREVLLSFQKLEMELANVQPKTIADPEAWYRDGIRKLDAIIGEQPNYASARNNRAQALRRLYGDELLIGEASSPGLVTDLSATERVEAVGVILGDLDRAVQLLSPATPNQAMSPQAAKTLSMVYTQRAAIYHATATKMAESTRVAVPEARCEASWTKMDFEEAASRDFALGGRYGNDIAKGLAVSVNPTAKLCGQIVREAMMKEYGPAYAS
jgi:hypothetical protein